MARNITYSPIGAALAPGKKPAMRPDDPYPDRLLKYIPAETLAFFAPISAYVGSNTTGLIVVFVIAVVGNILYLWSRTTGTVLPHFYVLSTIALFVWAITIDHDFAALCHIPDMWARIMLSTTVFLLPPIDELIAKTGW